MCVTCSSQWITKMPTTGSTATLCPSSTPSQGVTSSVSGAMSWEVWSQVSELWIMTICDCVLCDLLLYLYRWILRWYVCRVWEYSSMFAKFWGWQNLRKYSLVLEVVYWCSLAVRDFVGNKHMVMLMLYISHTVL